MTLLPELVTNVVVCSGILATIELLEFYRIADFLLRVILTFFFFFFPSRVADPKWQLHGLVAPMLCARLIGPAIVQVVNQFVTACNRITTCCSAVAGHKHKHRHLADQPEKKKEEKDRVALPIQSLEVLYLVMRKKRGVFVWRGFRLRKHRHVHVLGLLCGCSCLWQPGRNGCSEIRNFGRVKMLELEKFECKSWVLTPI